MGFEGTIKNIDVVNYNWQLQVTWRDAQIRIIAPEERFPHLRQASSDMTVRVLDTILQGLRHQPRAVITDLSEVFLVIAPIHGATCS